KRYASALELADELRRYLDGKPIAARPVGRIERLWRWARRKPALAALAAFATLTIITGIVLFVRFKFFTWSLSREERVKQTVKASDQGIALCEAGDGGQGLLWLARALELAPPDADDLHRVIRANLGAWRHRINPLTMMQSLAEPVTLVASSPDGKILLTASLEETRLWQADGKPIAALVPHRGAVLAAHFSADGKTIVTRNLDRIQRWDATTGAAIGSALEARYMVLSANFSADGQTILTGSKPKKIAQLWNASSGFPVGKPLEHRDGVTAVALSRDGKTALTGTLDGEVQLWDLDN